MFCGNEFVFLLSSLSWVSPIYDRIIILSLYYHVYHLCLLDTYDGLKCPNGKCQQWRVEKSCDISDISLKRFCFLVLVTIHFVLRVYGVWSLEFSFFFFCERFCRKVVVVLQDDKEKSFHHLKMIQTSFISFYFFFFKRGTLLRETSVKKEPFFPSFLSSSAIADKQIPPKWKPHSLIAVFFCYYFQ